MLWTLLDAVSPPKKMHKRQNRTQNLGPRHSLPKLQSILTCPKTNRRWDPWHLVASWVNLWWSLKQICKVYSLCHQIKLLRFSKTILTEALIICQDPCRPQGRGTSHATSSPQQSWTEKLTNCPASQTHSKVKNHTMCYLKKIKSPLVEVKKLLILCKVATKKKSIKTLKRKVTKLHKCRKSSGNTEWTRTYGQWRTI